MECWMLWNGGSNYSTSEIPDDLERFDSLYRLKRAFESRLCDSYYPCVSDETPEDGGPEAYVYFRDPSGERDPYPDRLLKYGPRGGLRLEYA